uniref:Vesicle-associated membrane protein n=1 Tax=Elaeophora elaphi TaxID=1147741 RepID=A0A0R3S216_9BILA
MNFRLSTINRAMEHLKLNRRSSVENAENVAKDEGEPTAVSELRKWLQTISEKLSVTEDKFTKAILARKELNRLAADQQCMSPSPPPPNPESIHNCNSATHRHVTFASSVPVQSPCNPQSCKLLAVVVVVVVLVL